MALVLKDRVRETTTVLGTNDAVLLGAVTGFQSFSVVGSANTCYYCIADQSGGNWEVGIGTYSSVGPTLARTTILDSSNSGTIVSFPAGTKDVFLTYPSEKAVYTDASGNLTLTGDLSVNGNTTLGNASSDTITFTAQAASNLVPTTNNTYNLGSATNAWKDVYANGSIYVVGGTANGVMYLNSSKVVTTGSALTFDGTTFTSGAHTLSTGNLNFGGTAQRITGDFSNATVANRVSIQNSTTNADTFPSIIPNGTSTNAGLNIINNSDPTNAGITQLRVSSTESTIRAAITGTGTYLPMTFYTGGSERMRIDSSGNVGIGTSSPVTKLNVANGNVSTTIDYSFGSFRASDGAYVPMLKVASGTNTTVVTGGYGAVSSGSTAISLRNIGDTELVSISAGGNVGIGTASPGAKLQIQSGTSPTQPVWASSDVVIAGNSAGNAAYYQSFSDTAGGIVFSTPSTRARSLILWSEASGNMLLTNGSTGAIVLSNNGSERMRIDSSGNVGIGTSSPNSKLVVGTPNPQSTPTLLCLGGTTQSVAGGSGQLGIYGTDAAAADKGGTVSFSANTTSLNGYAMATISGKYQTAGAGVYGGYLQFCTTDSAGSIAERARIDSSGNVGIGTSSPYQKLTVAGAISTSTGYYLGTDSASVNAFTALSTRSNTTSGGAIVVRDSYGAYNSGGIEFYAGSAPSGSEAMRIDSSGNLNIGNSGNFGGKVSVGFDISSQFGIFLSPSSSTYTKGFIGFNNAGGSQVGSITTNGSSTSYVTSSDYRLKENIQPMQNALSVVAQLNPVTYNWKADGSDGQGFIAHELQAVVPDCVTGEKDAVDAEGKPVYQGIDTSFLVATLTKAIQEQQEQINQLKAEVAALKGN